MLQLSAENAAIDDCIYFLDQSIARWNYPAGCIFEGGTEVESTTVYGKGAFD